MNTHVDKTKENKSQFVANTVSQKPSGGDSLFQFEDNRPEAIQMKKFQEMANTSSHVSQLRVYQEMANTSSRVSQLRAIQDMATSSSQVRQVIQLQSIANNNTPTLQAQGLEEGEADHMSTETRQMEMAPLKDKEGGNPPIQRVILNMGDDKDRADRDGPKLENKLGQEYVQAPLQELKDQDAIMKTGEEPMTVMFHGSTLQKMGAMDFGQLMYQKGFQRGVQKELVLVTCSAARIMKEDGQALADFLDTTIHAAKGKVVVNEEGIPTVRIKNRSGPESVKQEDIYSIIGSGEFMEEHAEGWEHFRPSADGLRGNLEEDLRYCDNLRDYLNPRVDKLDEITNDFMDQEDLKTILSDMTNTIVNYWADRERDVETMEQMHQFRQILDEYLLKFSRHQQEMSEIEAAYLKIHGQSVIRSKRLEYIEGGDSDEGGSGWGDDEELTELLAQEPPSTETATSGVGNVEQSSDTGSKPATDAPISMKRINEPIQRVIIDDTDLGDDKQLKDLTTVLNDINLVTEVPDLDLELKFDDTEKSYAHTALFMDNVKGKPEDFFVPENKDMPFKIVITMNERGYADGKNAEALGSMISTLTHEWELHGRQHALNIQKLRMDQDPDVVLDHQQLFAKAGTGMDEAIARQIQSAPEELRQDIYNSYLNDAVNHIAILQEPFLKDDSIASLLYSNLEAVKQNLSMLSNFNLLVTPQVLDQEAGGNWITMPLKVMMSEFMGLQPGKEEPKKEPKQEEEAGTSSSEADWGDWDSGDEVDFGVKEDLIIYPEEYDGPTSLPLFKHINDFLTVVRDCLAANSPQEQSQEVLNQFLDGIRAKLTEALPWMEWLAEAAVAGKDPKLSRRSGLHKNNINTIPLAENFERQETDKGYIQPNN